ncbi:hypothetical protein BDZ89DRAFT_373159 [Hymenopellis radicata]|nr:hypothetical protein BDZ89DRAFT_373159 [Hymenopellis radicata]
MKARTKRIQGFLKLTIFSMFGQQFMNLLACFNDVTAAQASLDRLTAFLHDVSTVTGPPYHLYALDRNLLYTELLDRFASEEKVVTTIGDAVPTPDSLELGHAMFSWSNVSGKPKATTTTSYFMSMRTSFSKPSLWSLTIYVFQR